MKSKPKIKKSVAICAILSIICGTQAFSQKVKTDDLLKVTQNVLLKEKQENKKIEKMIPLGVNNDTTIYIAQLEKEGFIILSADYTAPPVLGYCHKGIYNPDSLPGGLSYLIDKYQKEISSLRENKANPTTEVNLKWDKYLNNETQKSVEMVTSVNNLGLNTKWQQGDYFNDTYNRFCPDHCAAGCAAVAMAQILYYWNWDVNQTGTNTHDGITINFGNQFYCYDRMHLAGADDYNSKLIYHAGVSCNTNYCDGPLGYGSGTEIDNTRAAFENFWGMSTDATTTRRLWIMIPSWENRLKDNIDNGDPILYGSEGHHGWVISGYDDDDKFYCIWGAFDGDLDDYYSLGGFNPNGNDFNDYEKAVFHIHPATHVAYELSGPENVTSTPVQFDIENPADCHTLSCDITPNLQIVYGVTTILQLKQ